MSGGSVKIDTTPRRVEPIDPPTLRDLFAVHAPPAPDWFKGIGGPPPSPRPDKPQGLSERGSDLAEKIRCGDVHHIGFALSSGAIGDGEAAELYRFSKEVADWRRENVAREIGLEQRRLIQWRWHYADLMLAHRPADPR